MVFGSTVITEGYRVSRYIVHTPCIRPTASLSRWGFITWIEVYNDLTAVMLISLPRYIRRFWLCRDSYRIYKQKVVLLKVKDEITKKSGLTSFILIININKSNLYQNVLHFKLKNRKEIMEFRNSPFLVSKITSILRMGLFSSW